MRRESIIRKLAASTQYTEGEICTPYCEKERAIYGDSIVVEKICDSYAKYGKNEKWPSNDCPMIITAWSRSKQERFNCTPKYLVPLIVEESISK